MLISLVVLPLWLPLMRRCFGGRLILLLGVAAVIAGLVLVQVNADTNSFSSRTKFTDTFLLVSIICGMGALMWARSVLPLWLVGTAYGLGVLAQQFLSTPPFASGNAWKFFWSFPLAIILFSLTSASKRPSVDVVALAGFGLLCAMNDSRSFAATFFLALILRLWQLRPRSGSTRQSVALSAVFLAAVAYTTYRLIESLLVEGYLGEQAQLRTISQLQATGSLLLGGRPELAATVGLMRDSFWGLGVGALPNPMNIATVQRSMAQINYNANNNGYVDRYMLGNGVELHSMFGDVWVRWGPVGLLLLLVLVLLFLYGLLRQINARTANGLVLFLGIWMLWNVFFSPLLSAAPTAILLGAVVLQPRSRPSAEGADQAAEMPAAPGVATATRSAKLTGT